MNNTIKCPKCGHKFEASEALTHQIEEQVLASIKSEHKLELEEVKKEALEISTKRIDEEKDRNRKLTSQIDELLGEIRKLREKDEDREIEMKRKLIEEEDKIRNDTRKKAAEEHEFKDLEKEKIISDLKKSLEEMKRKAEQGSQQSQGEILELEFESKLRSEFPDDIVSEVKKGQRGADAVQEVIDKNGKNCGTILWENKNAQWSEGWIGKLKEDQRQAKADLAVLVSVNLPDKTEVFTYKDGVWICSIRAYLPLAKSLRYALIRVAYERTSSEGKDEKMKVLYNYLTGNEFRQRIEGIVESFTNLQEELEKEKRWFSVKWARQEKEIRKVIDHTHGMYGDLQGVIGKSLPEIKSLELPSG
jgi:hypothetical protein